MPDTAKVLRPPAVVYYADELAALIKADKNPRPPGWKLSPKAVRAFICGQKSPKIARKFFGDDVLIERAIVGLAGNRGLLLVGEPGTAKSMLSELLAAAIVNLLAERKGWTLDELADRTMPTAGFDDAGTLELNLGSRKFTARVNSELAAVLFDEEGKALKKLPDPRKGDDEALAKAAKKTFSAAKAELKKFAASQTARLYEAMCTQRTWPAQDWRTYVLGHPLLRFLCQRLVWAVVAGEEIKQTFRPLDDGTFTDFDDREVTFDDEAQIRIAHGCHVSDDVASAWLKHLADYDVSPLFTQFGREAYRLAADKRAETSIDDFQGHLVEAFKLRGLATRFGYTRGAAQDGGWFYEYHKSFSGLGLNAQLNFSGNGLPEGNRTVALLSLSFQKSAPQPESFTAISPDLPLSEVPAVLLSECYNDLRTIAAAGTGFDSDWAQKVSP